MSRFGVVATALVCAFGFTSASARSAAAAGSCGKSFIDVDNNGVCSPGDVNLAPALAGLAGQYTGNSIDVTQNIYSLKDNTLIYTPPADGHPVGIVFGGSITLGVETDFSAFATGVLHFNGRFYLNTDASLEANACESVDFGRGSRLVETGVDDTYVEIVAQADACGSATGPLTMHFSQSSRFQTDQFMRFIADHMVIDNHVQFQTTAAQPNVGAAGDIELNSGDLTMGKGVQFLGTAEGEIYLDNCGSNVTADHLLVTVGSFDWESTNDDYLCDEVLSDGTVLNPSDQPQRITITNSRLTSPYGFIGTRGNPDGATYPCDAITLKKTKFDVNNFGFAPTPRVDPTGPCTGTITG